MTYDKILTFFRILWSFIILHQMDVKTSFLNSEVEEEVYIEQPEGLIIHRSHICKLKKSLYRLKQAPRAWDGKIDSFLQSLGA
jgi:hypothetical protein